MRTLALLAAGLVACAAAVQPPAATPAETTTEGEESAMAGEIPPTPALAATAQPVIADPWEPKEAKPAPFENPWANDADAPHMAWVQAHCELHQPDSFLFQPVCNPTCPPKVRIWPCAEYTCADSTHGDWVKLANDRTCAIARGTAGRVARPVGAPPVDKPRTEPRGYVRSGAGALY